MIGPNDHNGGGPAASSPLLVLPIGDVKSLQERMKGKERLVQAAAEPLLAVMAQFQIHEVVLQLEGTTVAVCLKDKQK